MNQVAFERVCIDTIRFLTVDAVERAKSGYPGTPMGPPRWRTCSMKSSASPPDLRP
jgi:transketolase